MYFSVYLKVFFKNMAANNLINKQKKYKKLKKTNIKMGPGPRFEPESQDPQSRRITAYPTPAFDNK